MPCSPGAPHPGRQTPRLTLGVESILFIRKGRRFVTTARAFRDRISATFDVVARELATEQAHVDAVYDRLAEATRARRVYATQGQDIFRLDRESWMREEHGTALFERDAFAFQAARRLAVLDAEHEGLVFGRLDQTVRSATSAASASATRSTSRW